MALQDPRSKLRQSLAALLDFASSGRMLSPHDVGSILAGTFPPTSEMIALGKGLCSIQEKALALSDQFARSMFAEEIELWKQRVAICRRIEYDAKSDTRLLDPFAVVRQEAVGHGGFHSGALGFVEPLLRWVYDCGSWRKPEALKRRIDGFLNRSRRDHNRPDIDLLFLSHFDADHVNGLEMLFAGRDEMRATVDTVVAPYLRPLEVFAALGRAVSRRKCSSELIDAIARPQKYFEERGVRYLILVRPEEPSGTPGDTLVPLPTPPTLDGPRGDLLMATVFHGGDGNPLNIPPPEPGKIRVIDAKPGVTCEVASYGRWIDWIFVPHAHEWGFNHIELSERVRKIGLNPTDSDFHTALIDLLRTKQGIKEIKKIYCGLESNGTSMSLYVGPPPWKMNRNVYARPGSPAGWLLTGDAPLNGPAAFARWKRSFTPVAPNAGRFMLPHHGAKANFNKDILTFVANAKPFVTVDHRDFENRKRPPMDVRRKIGRTFNPITERRGLTEISGPPEGKDCEALVSHW